MLNWAAIDAYRQLEERGRLQSEGEEHTIKNFGSLDAAFTGLCWGYFHGVAQYHLFLMYGRRSVLRAASVVAGLLLPQYSAHRFLLPLALIMALAVLRSYLLRTGMECHCGGTKHY